MEYKYRILVLLAEREVNSGKPTREIREAAAAFIGLSYSQFNRLTRSAKNSTTGFTPEALEQLAEFFEQPIEALFNGKIKINNTKTYQFI